MLSEAYGRIGGDWDPKKLVRALRLRFSDAATLGDYDESPDYLAKETDCIGEIILALGGRESTDPDKTFSTPSDHHIGPVLFQAYWAYKEPAVQVKRLRASS